MTRAPHFVAVLLSAFLFGFVLPDDDGKPEHNPGIADQRSSNSLPFIPKLHWGMTRPEIQDGFPELREHWVSVASDTPNHLELEITHYEIAGCRFRVEFNFFNRPENTLADLQAYPEAANTEECLGRVRAKLLDVLGPHPWWDHEGGYSGGKMFSDETRMVWMGKVTTISFETSDDLKTGKRSFRVVLQHTGAAGNVIE